jgi:hypothetical protein
VTKKTRGPKAFLRSLRDAIARMEDGSDVSMSAHFECVSGIGRVATMSADGKDVDDADLPTFDLEEETPVTEPGKGQKGPR